MAPGFQQTQIRAHKTSCVPARVRRRIQGIRSRSVAVLNARHPITVAYTGGSDRRVLDAAQGPAIRLSGLCLIRVLLIVGCIQKQGILIRRGFWFSTTILLSREWRCAETP